LFASEEDYVTKFFHPTVTAEKPGIGDRSAGGYPMERPLVELKNIVKTFGNVCALDGVDFSINQAEIIGLVGDNGAGKSTLIKIIWVRFI
jgi:simple sugar transport system ATP-binding protein